MNENLIKREPFEDFNNNYDFVAFFDENGSADALYYIKETIEKGKTIDENQRYFTLTCCIFSKYGYSYSRNLINDLKKRYWKKPTKCPIVLHTKDIVKKEKCFRFGTEKKYEKFVASLSNVINLVRCRVISITFDLYSYAVQGYNYDPYEVAFDTIVRVIMGGPYEDKRFALVFEARGKKEDTLLAEHINKIINVTGTKDFKKDFLQEKIKGVHFNHKTSKDGSIVYPGIEIVDLCSYPLFRYQRYGTRKQDFEIVIKKVVGYSEKSKETLIMRGFRHFPKEWNKK